MNKSVCKIVGFDEFGPLLEWSKHWSEFPVGTSLAAHEAEFARAIELHHGIGVKLAGEFAARTGGGEVA